MSERNVQLMRRFNDAFNARDIDAMLAICDPSIEFHSAFAAVGGAVYHGHDGLRRWHKDYDDAWGAEIRIASAEYFDLDQQTLTFVVLRGRGRHSRAAVEMAPAQVVRWRDGMMVYLEVYTKREDALRDLGVSEDELERIEP
jgi:ketosteroid isomerase-like protein